MYVNQVDHLRQSRLVLHQLAENRRRVQVLGDDVLQGEKSADLYSQHHVLNCTHFNDTTLPFGAKMSDQGRNLATPACSACTHQNQHQIPEIDIEVKLTSS